ENSISGSRRLLVESDKVIYRPGEPIEIKAQAFDENMTPTVAYQVTAQPRGSEVISLVPSSRDSMYRGEAAARLRPNATTTAEPDAFLQRQAIEITALDGDDEIARQTLEVQVLDDSPELLHV